MDGCVGGVIIVCFELPPFVVTRRSPVAHRIVTREWSPQYDTHLTSDGYTQYDMDTLVEGKRQCKVRRRGGRSVLGLGVGLGVSGCRGV